MIRIKRIVLALLLLCVAAVCGAQPVSSVATVAVSMKPDHIEVGTFYDGADVLVSADLPACEDAVVVLEGEAEELKLNRKGRVAGIWLNVTQVTVTNAPKVYLLATSDELDRICTADEQKSLHLGAAYLREQIGFTCDRPLTGKEFNELLNLKEHRGTYELEAPLSLSLEDSNRVALAATLPISPAVPPGGYGVRLYGFSDHRLICEGSATLSIERVGMAEWLAKLSRNHGAVYGSVAIAVAILVGIVMGVVFHRLPGGH